ncbi:ferredoxin--NADP reductase [Marinimicrobium alkaliphilum]|uniref:ferredoxin--NADP reductase n=1 Tax=Marinimicrobium alkaliphilum TaxID=2202654 RepID=UPI000DBA63C4|nr:ferredoxin--NADP reductase [Marinimicrobium alkaliphilum]
MANWLSATLTGKTVWNERLCSVRFTAELPPFEAGQFVNLAYTMGDKQIVRPYSLVNPPGTKEHEILFNLVPEGQLSSWLWTMTQGEQFLCGPRAQGFFTLGHVQPTEDLWLMATGSGLGPYLSMLGTDAPWEKFRQVILVHSVRDHHERAYLDELKALQHRHAGRLRILHTLTREPTWPLRQRIPALIESGLLEMAANTPISAERSHVMLCGNPGMVKGAQALLEVRGLRRHQRFAPGQISTEIY